MLAEFALERFFAAHEFAVPHLLCASDCESLRVDEVLGVAGVGPDKLGELRLGYTDARGAARLRAAIARCYMNVAPDDVLVASSPVEAIYCVVSALVEAGDEVVVLTPCYQALAEVARSRGAAVRAWPVRAGAGTGWHADPDELRRLVTPATRLVIVNFPHNPTGVLPSREEFTAIVEAATAHGAWLLCDEMYRGLEYDAERRLPAGVDASMRAVSLCGMSKSYGLPGLRTGWIACRDRALLGRVARVKDYTSICGSAPSEYLATLAVEHADAIVGRNRALVVENLSRVEAFMARHEALFSWYPVHAGPLGFPRLRDGSAADFCDRVREGAGVLLAPATLFAAGDAHVRFGFGRQGCARALEVLDAYLGAGV